MSESIHFDTGLVTYDLNDCVSVSFNPTDPAFFGRVYDAFDALDKKQEAYRKEIETADKRAVLEITRRLDAEMRQTIDELFDQPVCAPLFGKMNVYAVAGGLPVWANLMLAIIEKAEDALPKERAQTQAKIAKYTAKYHK